jgi:hypothetical protein
MKTPDKSLSTSKDIWNGIFCGTLIEIISLSGAIVSALAIVILWKSISH